MKKISIIVDNSFKSNNLFNPHSSLNRDNCLYQYIELKKKLASIHIDISTQDINKVENSDLIIFMNAPSEQSKLYKKSLALKKKIILIENEHFDIHKENRNIKKLKGISKVFSYRDFLYDNGINLNYSFDFSKSSSSFENEDKLILSCMISNNKSYDIQNELYTERKKVIKWFNKNKQDDFILYGGDWDKIVLKSNHFINKIINRLKITRPKLKVYKGICKDKSEVLRNSMFSFCFENSISKGWITEKLFDVMINRCVPIYFGPPEIKKHVPDNTYINYEDFNSLDDLYNFLKLMDKKAYQKYISNIDFFLKKINDDFPFHIDYHNKVLLDFIKKEI